MNLSKIYHTVSSPSRNWTFFDSNSFSPNSAKSSIIRYNEECFSIRLNFFSFANCPVGTTVGGLVWAIFRTFQWIYGKRVYVYDVDVWQTVFFRETMNRVNEYFLTFYVHPIQCFISASVYYLKIFLKFSNNRPRQMPNTLAIKCMIEFSARLHFVTQFYKLFSLKLHSEQLLFSNNVKRYTSSI